MNPILNINSRQPTKSAEQLLSANWTDLGILFAATPVWDRGSHLDNLDQLIHTTVSWEYGLSEQQLRQNAAR